MTLNNANISFEAVDVDGLRIRIAIPQSPNNCWATSLCTAIGPVARQEIEREMTGPSALAATLLSHVFERIGRLLRIDDVVFPEHHLLTTSLYGRAELPALLACRESLMARYPDKAIVMRSLNAHDHAAYIDRTCWPFRMVWFIDNILKDCVPRRDFKRDALLLSQLNLSARVYGRSVPDAVLSACLELYRALYLDTYSAFNPDYDAAYLKDLLAAGVLEILTLEDEGGQVEAFCALHICEDTMSVPLVGYNPMRPRDDGLYRAMIALAFQTAARRGLQMNLSAGASLFKRNRGAKPYMEYLLIIDQHLPVWRRWGYALIGHVLRLMGPALERTAS